MEIKELKDEIELLRRILADDIQSRINTFKSKTGVNIASVSVSLIDTRTMADSSSDSLVNDVNVEITL